MKKFITSLVFLTLLAVYSIALDIKVYFSPKGGGEQAVIEQIDKAHTVIYVQAYSFTSKPIADALIRAAGRAVRVAIIVDKSQPTAKANKIKECLAGGCKVFVDRKHAIQHCKIMIIDGVVVLTGSFNWTESAELRNAENLLVIDTHETDLADIYLKNWQEHVSHSEEAE